MVKAILQAAKPLVVAIMAKELADAVHEKIKKAKGK